MGDENSNNLDNEVAAALKSEAETNVIALLNLTCVTENHLTELFAPFGTILHVVVNPPLEAGMVIFSTTEAAKAAMNALASRPIGGRTDVRLRYGKRIGLCPETEDNPIIPELLVPPPQRLFLISPPPSPPADWVSRPEDGPNCVTSVDLDPPYVMNNVSVLLDNAFAPVAITLEDHS